MEQTPTTLPNPAEANTCSASESAAESLLLLAAQEWVAEFGPPGSRSSCANPFLQAAERAFTSVLPRIAWEEDTVARAESVVRPGPSGTKRLRLVLDVADRDGWSCCYCAGELTIATATLEHVLARSKGGGDELDNLAMACRSCNSRKGARDVSCMTAKP